MKNDFFKLKDHGTTVRREVLALSLIHIFFRRFLAKVHGDVLAAPRMIH